MRFLLTLIALLTYPVTLPAGPVELPAPAVQVVKQYEATPAGVAAYIFTVAPKIGVREAKRIAGLIVKAATRRGVDPLLLAAIVRHESGFLRNQRNCHNNGCDHGLGQINDVHVDEMDLDADRLVTDDAYNLDVAAKLLAREKPHARGDPFWWSRYHDGRPRLRRAWEARVMPYLNVARQEVLRAQT